MVTPQQLYANSSADYWENKDTGEIFYLFDRICLDDWNRKVCTSIEASAYNLRKGEPCVLTLKDFSKLEELDASFAGQLHESFYGWEFAHRKTSLFFRKYLQSRLKNWQNPLKK